MQRMPVTRMITEMPRAMRVMTTIDKSGEIDSNPSRNPEDLYEESGKGEIQHLISKLDVN